MIDNVNVNIKLKGEYKLNIIENNSVIYSTPWSNNTILSGGLVDLYSNSIPDLLMYLDIGTSNLLSGSNGYGLSGVISPSKFKNVLRGSIETYQDTLTSKTYYTSFTTTAATSSITVSEFAIKRSPLSGAFARNTFLSSYSILEDQIINFEYKLTVGWGSTTTSRLPITGNNFNYTYTIPITSTTYNIPYDRVYYNNNYLFLLGNIYDESYLPQLSLPNMGDAYPYFYEWGIKDSATSIYKPIELLSSIDNTTRKVSVTTIYNNITCNSNAGVFDNITTALLVKDADLTSYNYKFNATRFAYPLVVYNDYKTCNLPLNTETQVVILSTAPEFNILSLAYTYTWGECININNAEGGDMLYEDGSNILYEDDTFLIN